jgi:hypothetical protein
MVRKRAGAIRGIPAWKLALYPVRPLLNLNARVSPLESPSGEKIAARLPRQAVWTGVLSSADRMVLRQLAHAPGKLSTMSITHSVGDNNVSTSTAGHMPMQLGILRC